MSSELEQRLRAALHEDAQRARLVNPDGPPVPEARPLPDGAPPRRSARRVVAVAAAIALIAAAGVVVIQDREQEPEVATRPSLEADENEGDENEAEENEADENGAEKSEGALSTDAALRAAELFAGFPPGATVELPPAPISERALPAVVWTGTEVIVWSGMDAAGATAGDGAAYDPATGTWRMIAPAPIDPRLYAAVAWTGTEMLVWGGQRSYASGGGSPNVKDGAAYDPKTDTWRRLAEGPFDAWQAGGLGAWTGDELIVIGLEPNPPAGEHKRMAAYDPTTDEWRQLADVPDGTDFDLVWTGDRLLTTVTGYSTTTGEGTSTEVFSYDPSRDSWDPVGGLESVDVSLLAVRDVDGSVRAALALGHETGAPITVLDRTGKPVGTLPAIPGDRATLGRMSASGGVWMGDEGVFWIRPLGSEDPPAHWALSWSTQTWRSLDASAAPPLYSDLTPVPGAGAFIGFSGVTSENGGVSSGFVYRPPTPPDD